MTHRDTRGKGRRASFPPLEVSSTRTHAGRHADDTRLEDPSHQTARRQHEIVSSSLTPHKLCMFASASADGSQSQHSIRWKEPPDDLASPPNAPTAACVYRPSDRPRMHMCTRAQSQAGKEGCREWNPRGKRMQALDVCLCSWQQECVSSGSSSHHLSLSRTYFPFTFA